MEMQTDFPIHILLLLANRWLHVCFQFLPVPELMPFRLTRQFLNLMLPLKESGTLQSVMVHTLRALRNNHQLLLNTMDVFIKEPSLDWQVCWLYKVLSFRSSLRNIQTKTLNIPHYKTATGQRSFLYRAVTIWNNLASYRKLSSSMNIFKHKLRNHLLMSRF